MASHSTLQSPLSLPTLERGQLDRMQSPSEAVRREEISEKSGCMEQKSPMGSFQVQDSLMRVGVPPNLR